MFLVMCNLLTVIVLRSAYYPGLNIQQVCLLTVVLKTSALETHRQVEML